MFSLRKIYDWALTQAEKPYAAWILFLVAFIEPCLLPIPPDTILIPMCIAKRERCYHNALIATLGSVLGGCVGYGIGALAMATIGNWIVQTYNLAPHFEHFKHAFHEYGMWIILAKGLTPIPFIL